MLDSLLRRLLQTIVDLAKDFAIINLRAVRRLGRLSVGLLGVLLASSCNNPSHHDSPPPVMAPTENGRFQIVSSAETGRGTVLFLVDTRDGTTWIYRGPQGNAFNGFWSNIPKAQFSESYWNDALRQLFVPPTPPQTNAPSSTPPPAPTQPNTPPAPAPPKP